jgi:hypothetical protein
MARLVDLDLAIILRVAVDAGELGCNDWIVGSPASVQASFDRVHCVVHPVLHALDRVAGADDRETQDVAATTVGGGRTIHRQSCLWVFATVLPGEDQARFHDVRGMERGRSLVQ